MHSSESGQREGWHPEKQAEVEAAKGEGAGSDTPSSDDVTPKALKDTKDGGCLPFLHTHTHLSFSLLFSL